MATRGLDDKNDWLFGNGMGDYLHDHDEIIQNIKTRLKSFTDDWFLDLSANINWLGLIGRGNEIKIKREIQRVVLSTKGVTGISNISYTITKDRVIRVAFHVSTIYKKTQLIEDLSINDIITRG